MRPPSLIYKVLPPRYGDNGDPLYLRQVFLRFQDPNINKHSDECGFGRTNPLWLVEA